MTNITSYDCLDEAVKSKSFSEILRPQSIDDLLLIESTKRKLTEMSQSGNVMNMIFFGPPGTGKTTCAKLIANSERFEHILLSASTNYSSDKFMDRIQSFARSSSFYFKKKLILVDDGQFVAKKDLFALRTIIDEKMDSCRFIFTSNDLSIFDDALMSRFYPISFDVQMKDYDFMKSFLSARIQQKLLEVNRSIDNQTIERIISRNFPCYRKIAHELEFSCC